MIRMTALALCCAAAGFAGESGSAAQVADAVRQQDQLALRHLLQAKADVNATLADGSTALHWAVENDDPDTVGTPPQSRRQPERRGSLRHHPALQRLRQRQRRDRTRNCSKPVPIPTRPISMETPH